MQKKTINYSQCWEDPYVLTQALSINQHDRVLSVTSGGDNTLALLALQPSTIVSIDMNPAQNYLLELKNTAISTFSHQEALAFLGIVSSNSRKAQLKKLSKHLSLQTNEWWNKNIELIEKGVITCGRFERYLGIFRTILPFIHSKKIVKSFLESPTLKEQQEFYQKTWNSKRWKLYFHLATSRFILKWFARQKGMFIHVKLKKIADIYTKRLASHLMNVHLKNNFFMHYCLTGSYGTSLPPYLQEKNQHILKKNREKLTIVTTDLLSYLRSVPENFFTKYNLSDIFEALSENQQSELWKEIIRTAKNTAKVVYWDNLMIRPVPNHFSKQVILQGTLASQLFATDRVFFYDKLYIYDIVK